MRTATTTPTISVDIGGQIRIYQAFVTTARPPLDGPSTLTLHTSNFADVAGFAANPIPFNAEFGRKTARIVLVDMTELAWHRASYRRRGLPLRGRRPAPDRTPGAAEVALAPAPRTGAGRSLGMSTNQQTATDGQHVHSGPLDADPSPRRTYAHLRENHARRRQRASRQARGRRTAFRGWRTRWPEADRLCRVDAARRQRLQRHVWAQCGGCSAHRSRRRDAAGPQRPRGVSPRSSGRATCRDAHYSDRPAAGAHAGA